MVARYTLDTDAVIRMSESPDTVQVAAERVASGAVEFLITRVQVDELCRVDDYEAVVRRVFALLRLRVRLVLTNIVVLDVSRWDMARWGSDEDSAAFDRHVGTGANRGRHAEGATIASSARLEDAVLVTLNRKDLNRFRRGQPDLRVIGWEEFSAELAVVE